MTRSMSRSCVQSTCKSMSFFKTTFLNGLAVLIRLLCFLGINKVIAIYVGPSGYAAVGQFQNVIQVVTTLGSGAISNGVTKYTAEYREDEARQAQLWSTACCFSLLLAISLSLLILLLSTNFSILVFGDETYSDIFVWLGLGLVFFVGNGILLAILNGKRDIPSYVLANILGSTLSLLTTYLLVVAIGLKGALISLSIYQSIAFISTLAICLTRPWFLVSKFFHCPSYAMLLDLLKFTAMAMASAAFVPVCQILVRTHLANVFGSDLAGYWEAMNRLSSSYLLLLTATLSVYFLPKFSETVELSRLKDELLKCLIFVFAATIFLAGALYIMRGFVISFLFDESFFGMEVLFPWHLAGDIFKMLGWVYGFLLLSKARYKAFIVLEAIYALGVYWATVLYVDEFGFVGAAVSHFTVSLVYLIAASGFVHLAVVEEKQNNA